MKCKWIEQLPENVQYELFNRIREYMIEHDFEHEYIEETIENVRREKIVNVIYNSDETDYRDLLEKYL